MARNSTPRACLSASNVYITGMFSRKADNRTRFAKYVAELCLGECTRHDSLESLTDADVADTI